MKISRKLLGFSLLACFVVSALIAMGISGVGMISAAAADVEKTDVNHYFYNQLGNEEKAFYEAMEDMHRDGMFIEGTDYDLVAKGRVTQAQLEAYANGDSHIITVMGAARDAFYTDYNDIFYVDFDALSLRVTQDSSGKYHAFLGAGRRDTYWLEEFENQADGQKAIEAAIVKYNAALKEAVDAAKAAEPTAQQIKVLGEDVANQVAQIREAHRQVAKSTYYRLENDAENGAGHVRTPYGVFVTHEALCEGYSRAFKAILDEIGVPCVLVNGVYRHGNNQEEIHMWTHVKLLDGNWYAVDPTFDDLNYDDLVKYPPEKYYRLISRTTPLDDIEAEGALGEHKDENETIYDKELGYYYSEDYFLKGAAYMNTQHATSPYKSESEYPFTYPELTQQNLGGEVSLTHGVFKVVQTAYNNNLDSTNIYVSVLIDGEWCGYAEAEAKGYYILVRYEGNYLPEKLLNHQDLSHVGDDEFLVDNGSVKHNTDTRLVWAYLNPIREPEPMYPNIKEFEGYTVIENESKSTGFEFALTTRAPRPYDGKETDIDRIAEMTTFTGDMTMFEARSGVVNTLFGDPDYQPAPHIIRSTPALTGKLMLSSYQKRTFNITVEYDQILKLMDGATELKMSVYGIRATGEILKGTNAVRLEECVDLSTVSYDLGEQLPDGSYRCGSVSFKFIPYSEWAYDSIEYIFNFNLEGVNSHKQVNPATYAVGYECEALCYRANGYHWNVFAQPQLLEDEDLSRTGWTDSNGDTVTDTKSRLALVVTRPSQKQEGEMMDLIEDNFDEDILESFTYNISLTICKSIVITTGQGVRVCVGFPEGFTYTDSMNGVSFKAYHFIRDKWDNVIDVEEIECTVTPLGLVLLCKSFSPFAIVAATADPTEVTTDKSVIISNNNGGTAYGDVKADDHNTKNLFHVTDSSNKVTIKANEGFVIESISINGKAVEVEQNATSHVLPLTFSELTASNIIDVKFVPAKVKQAEENNGRTVVVQKLKNAEISLAKTEVSVTAGDKVEVEATVTSYGDATSYQWFKDGVAVAGQTRANLLINSAETTDAGEYTLQVFSTSGSTTLTAQSGAVQVNVAAKPDGNGGNEPSDPKPGFKLNTFTILVATLGSAITVILCIIIVKTGNKSKKDNKKKK